MRRYLTQFSDLCALLSKRQIILFAAAALALSTGLTQGEEAAVEESAKALLEAFNAGDAETISDLFVENGELVLASGEVVSGSSEIRRHYEEIFADSDRPQAAVEVGSIRHLTDALVIEDGTVHLTSTGGGISSFFYQAVRTKQGNGEWKLASLRDVEGDQTQPSDKLSVLEWLIGDWLIQTPDGETWITFFWSEAGPYIDAKAVSESPEAPATSATMRIGWNENAEAFKSWGFDARGGFNQSDWITVAPGEFLLRTTGVTASGDRNVATQSLRRSDDSQSFTWTKRDQTIGGEPMASRTLTVVKRPPKPGSGTPEVE